MTSNSAGSTAFYSRIIHLVGALLVSFLFYAASSGPVTYYLVLQSNHPQGKREEFLTSLYAPLATIAHGLDLDEDYWAYYTAWIELAWKRHPDRIPDEMGMNFPRL